MPRIAIIDRDKCTKEKCGYICKKVCPGVAMGDDTVTIDDEGYPVISEILCTGCGICPKKCPHDAIKIINLAEEKGKLMHQYGVNTFRLYGVPLPQRGVTGLIGKNGIGKSTALSILSSNTTPNLGRYQKPPEMEDVIKELDVQEAEYFKKLVKRQINVALKPQNVDKIKSVVSGKVRGLLEKTDERRVLDEAIGVFELSRLMDKDIKHLSGGELQRVAIAACWCKEADLYYFDEPASYLDIEQRLRITKMLKTLGEQKNVIVIEHDLAMFDYLSEYVYVFFGQESAYGMVSGVKNTRGGINQYLAGFLKEENIRFRDHEIKFQKSVGTVRRSKTKIKYPGFSKRFDSFEFNSDPGELREGEVVGVVGKNAIGKSLFVKILAGVEKSDDGDSADEKLVVSYKPQYVKAFPGTVMDLFAKKKLNVQFFEEAQKKMQIHPLMDKEMDTLSGGELQRVAIVYALSQEADVYLLDEPSAFLDVEQRLHFASLVNRLIENTDKVALVVDHDLVLIDAISSRLMVFEGESSVSGVAKAPTDKKEGLNSFLKNLQITLRRDPDSFRPRINKPDSVLDREQKEAGEYYYYDQGKEQ